MRMKHRLASMAAVGLVWALGAAQAEQVGLVKKDRVNVRGQANVKSEVVTQLRKGEAVTILEEIPVTKPKKGEPAAWARIQLPPNTPVWVYAPYIETAGKTVNIRRVNIRSGPGENFSILGRLERGTPVKEIRTVAPWMEIESPTNAFAFVAADLLEKAPAAAPAPTLAAATPPPTTSTAPATNAIAETAPPVAETAKTEPAPAPAPDTPPAPAAISENKPTPPVTSTSSNLTNGIAVTTGTVGAAPSSTSTTPEPPPRRMVSREGIVIGSRSIQAPTDYALESKESRRTINYLHTEDPVLKLKNFGGRKVLVTGEELLDERWANTPIIEVETIRLVP
jgi:uncharacterized protein YgiM (DUF1202 family)